MMEGRKIREVRTLKTIYDNDSLSVCVGEDWSYRIKASEILKLLKTHNFIEDKKKKCCYLEVRE